MRVTCSEYKLWKKKNDLKKFFRKNRKKKKTKKNVKIVKSKVTEFVVPKVFSIINNPEETIEFFNIMIDEVERLRSLSLKKVRTFKIKMDETVLITGDALMYLLTIIKNTRGDRFIPINWYGTFPEDDQMQKFLRNSGYLNYMQTAKSNFIKTNDHIQIQTGHSFFINVDGCDIDIRKRIVDFTAEKLNKNKTEINFLMTMLTELITNIDDHAYNSKTLFEHSWYIFVENTPTKISYTFMDNGLGIPTTIRKRILELLFEKIDADKEYKYIAAAVSGVKKRSQTGKPERGNGLPSIYEPYTNGNVNNMVIISNHAYYADVSKDLVNNLYGTVFYWEILKEESVLDEN